MVPHIIYCLQTMQSLGFSLNLKGTLNPAQQFTFIGMEFLTQHNTVRVPLDCMESLLLTIKHFKTQVSAQTFLSLFGKLIAAADLILLGRLHLDVPAVSLPHVLPLDHQISITSMIRCHLKLWLHSGNIHLSSRSQSIPFHSCQPLWMGCSSRTDETILYGRLTKDQLQLHISLEIMAIRYALKEAIRYIHRSCVMISTDNTTVVSYINKQEGTHSPDLCIEVWEILH